MSKCSLVFNAKYFLKIIFSFLCDNMLPRCDESAIVRLGEVHTFVPLEAEYLKLETEGLQKQEEEELGILQYLDQLEQVTARYLTRLVLCYSHKVKLKEIFCFGFLFF